MIRESVSKTLDSFPRLNDPCANNVKRNRCKDTSVLWRSMGLLEQRNSLEGSSYPKNTTVFLCVKPKLSYLLISLLSSVSLEGLHALNFVNRELSENAENEIMKAVVLAGPMKAGRIIPKTRFWQIAAIWFLACLVGVSLTFL